VFVSVREAINCSRWPAEDQHSGPFGSAQGRLGFCKEGTNTFRGCPSPHTLPLFLILSFSVIVVLFYVEWAWTLRPASGTVPTVASGSTG
jgi:hypothetical protein